MTHRRGKDPGPAFRPRERFLTFGAPHIGEAEIAEVVATLRSGWIGTGPRVARFEAAFAAYKDTTHDAVAAVGSCTAALHLSLLAAGLGPGDEVITSAMTFCATVNAIIHAGATPVLVDVDARTMNMDPGAVAAAITPRTRAIVPVHFAGRPCDMDPLMELAHRHDLLVIEDCAHAIETEYRGRKTGTIGDFGCFSFYVTKNLVTGEGGMVVARDLAAAGRIRTLALHGLTRDAWRRFGDAGYRHYQVVECGFKYNMTDIQAAMGIHQLAALEENWKRRSAIWARYQSAFAGLPVALPAEPAPDTRHAFHLYTILIRPDAAGIDRDSFLDEMTALKVGVGVHYLAIPEHPFYQQTYGWKPESVPVAMDIGRATVSLPLSAALSDEDVDYVIDSVRTILGRA